MKYLLLIILVPFLYACDTESKQKEKTESDEYVPPSREQFVERYPSGIKKVEGELVDGKRHGKWIYYYENGFIWSEGKYRNGIREGYSLVYYKNGQKKITGQYKKNLRYGEWKVYEEDGSLVKAIDINKMLTPKDSVLLELK